MILKKKHTGNETNISNVCILLPSCMLYTASPISHLELNIQVQHFEILIDS